MGCANCREKTDKAKNETQIFKKPKVYFILGEAGSGKKSLCDKLVKKFGFFQLSIFELLQNEQNDRPESELTKIITKNKLDGNLITSDILIDLIRNAICKINKPNAKFIFNGFPENKENIDAWIEKKMDDLLDVEFCLFLECSFGTREKRILNKNQSTENLKNNDEKFFKKIKPILDYYETQGKLIHINAESDEETVANVVGKKFK